MHVTVKCFATLTRFQPEDAERYPFSSGERVVDLVHRLGIKPDEVAVLFVNGVHAKLDQVLADGDRVSLFPAVGGG